MGKYRSLYKTELGEYTEREDILRSIFGEKQWSRGREIENENESENEMETQNEIENGNGEKPQRNRTAVDAQQYGRLIFELN